MSSFACTDLGNAKRFQDYYKEAVRYIPELKQWVQFKDGWHYAKALNLSEPVVMNIYHEAGACPNEQQRTQLGQWAGKSQSTAFQRSLLAQAADKMVASLDQFDADPTLINCKNGVVNLQTKELLPHSPQQLHLKRIN